MSDNHAFVIDKNLGARWDEDTADLPTTNSEGLSVIEPTNEQKYLFDMQGWILIPGVLSESDCTEMKAFCE